MYCYIWKWLTNLRITESFFVTEDWEAKRLQREKESGDLVKKKFELAEKEKEKFLKTFEQTAKEASAERERILQKGEDILKDKVKHADEDKRRTLETFDKLAKHDDKKVQKTPGELHGPSPSLTPRTVYYHW